VEFDIFVRRVCPACESQERIPLFAAYDDRYGQPDLFTVLECQQCRTCYLQEAIVPEQIPLLYDKYYGYTAHDTTEPNPRQTFYSRAFHYLLRPSRIRVLYERWYRLWTAQTELVWSIRKSDRVLEIGCGYGGHARSVLARGARWTGVEIDSKACQRVRNQGIECLCGAIETLTLQAGVYDVIIASQVIEHTSDPRGFMRRAAELLRPGGRFLIATPNVASRYQRIFARDWIHWFVPYHQVLFSLEGIARLGQVSSFQMGRFWTETPTAWAILQKEYERPPQGERGVWASKRTPARLQPEVLSLRLRVEDMIRRDGDCLIAELVKS
jgi:2-polyprenyl-3-methyl-5-hydroxy-6-metoxy-1,4-benzoquinol methylase